MDQDLNKVIISLLLIVACTIPVIFFIFTQQKTLQYIRPENRKMSPGQVWWQLLPLVGLVWQFVVITRLSRSISQELRAPVEDSIVSDLETVTVKDKPTYVQGMLYAVLCCVVILVPFPTLKGILAIVGLVCWVSYWTQVSNYKRILKERWLLQGH
jgi:hypothetical protein